jgi:integrase
MEQPMPTKHLTDVFLRNVKPPNPDKGEPRQVVYLDRLDRGVSLVLVVSYGGTKAFRVLTYRNSKPHTIKLGTYPAMTLAEAKKQAREYHADPRKFAEQAAVGSFKEIAELWFKRHVEAKGLRSAPELRRILQVYIFPRWADRKFIDVRRRDVNELLDHVEDNHGVFMADKVLGVITGIMSWFARRDDHYDSPIVRGMLRGEATKRERILDDGEIRALWEASTGTFGAIAKLLLLSGQRKAKVTTLKWSDIDNEGVWTIRTASREKGNAGKLKLPPLALEVIKSQPRIAGNPHVFVGDLARGKRELDKTLNIPHWTLHDLRRAARSLLARKELGVSREIAEAVLGHAIGGVEGTYNRHQYFGEKADALERLAAAIQRIIDPPAGNVVALRR